MRHGRGALATHWAEVMIMSAFPTFRGSVLALSLSTLAFVACGGGAEPPVGTTGGALSKGGALSNGESSTCPATECKDQAVVCAGGAAPSHVRCVPDPNAGAGSDPVGHCILTADCPVVP